MRLVVYGSELLTVQSKDANSQAVTWRTSMKRSMPLVGLVVALLVVVAHAGEAQTVDEIIAKNLEAKGGIEALKATNSVKMTGKMTAQGMEVPMTVWAKRPNFFRQEMSVAGQSMIRAFDGRALWVMPPGMPAREMTDAPAAAKMDAEFDSFFIDYKQKGVDIELVGKDQIQGKATYHLKVSRKDGATQHYYLDAETGLEKKISTVVEQNGRKLTIDREPSDYRAVQGRIMPFRTVEVVDGKPMVEMTIESVEFNVPIEDALFKMPAK